MRGRVSLVLDERLSITHSVGFLVLLGLHVIFAISSLSSLI
jgi:hypothetical protein